MRYTFQVQFPNGTVEGVISSQKLQLALSDQQNYSVLYGDPQHLDRLIQHLTFARDVLTLLQKEGEKGEVLPGN